MFLVYIATIFRAWVKRMTYYSLHTHHPVTVLLCHLCYNPDSEERCSVV